MHGISVQPSKEIGKNEMVGQSLMEEVVMIVTSLGHQDYGYY